MFRSTDFELSQLLFIRFDPLKFGWIDLTNTYKTTCRWSHDDAAEGSYGRSKSENRIFCQTQMFRSTDFEYLSSYSSVQVLLWTRLRLHIVLKPCWKSDRTNESGGHTGHSPVLRFVKCSEARTLIISAPIHRPGAKFIPIIVRTCINNLIRAQPLICKTWRVAVIGPETLNFSVRRSYLLVAATEWDIETFIG